MRFLLEETVDLRFKVNFSVSCSFSPTPSPLHPRRDIQSKAKASPSSSHPPRIARSPWRLDLLQGWLWLRWMPKETDIDIRNWRGERILNSISSSWKFSVTDIKIDKLQRVLVQEMESYCNLSIPDTRKEMENPCSPVRLRWPIDTHHDPVSLPMRVIESFESLKRDMERFLRGKLSLLMTNQPN